MWIPATRALMVVSHIAFLLPIAVSFANLFFAQGIVWALVTTVSTLYHTCEVYPTACVSTYLTLLRVDTILSFTVSLVIVLSLVYPLVPIPIHLEFTLIGIFFLANVVLGLFVFPGHGSQFTMSIATGVFVIAASIAAYLRSGKERRYRGGDYWRWFHERIHVPLYFGGLVLLLLGVFLYFCDDLFGAHVYPITHMFWHVTIGLGAGVVLVGVRPYVKRKKVVYSKENMPR